MKIRHLLWTLLPAAMLSGCASLPHSGPSATNLRGATVADLSVVPVSPQQALRMADQQQEAQKRELVKALETLDAWGKQSTGARKIQPGSRIEIVLWTQPVHVFDEGKGDSLQSVKLGTYRVNSAGEIFLPYLGKVSLQGRTLPHADQLLSEKYQSLGRFAAPEVQIHWATKGYQEGVIVSGSVKEPGFLPWVPGGLFLPRVLADAGVSRTEAGQSKSKNNYPVVVSVAYRGNFVWLPLEVVWKSNIRLVPGERIIVQQPAKEQVTVLGGGAAHPGNYGFGMDVNLNQVLAESGGLLPDTANDREIFVLRKRGDQKAKLYVLRWNDAQGLLAAERFPMRDGDLLYVPTAPVVPLEKAVQIFSGFLMPPALLANAVK